MSFRDLAFYGLGCFLGPILSPLSMFLIERIIRALSAILA
jgi:hypothetical protein